MRLIYSVLALSLLSSAGSAQEAPQAEDCGCNPVQINAPEGARLPDVKKQELEPAQEEALAASRAALHAYREAESKRDSRTAWEKLLSGFATTENATMLMDLGKIATQTPPEIAFERAHRVEGMRAIARMTFTTWKQRQGVQVFSYTRGLPTVQRQKAAATFVDWLQDADGETKDKLTKLGLVLSQMPHEVRNSLLELVYENELPFVLLDRLDKTVVYLKLEPVATIPAAATFRQRQFDMALVEFIPSLYEGKVYIPKVDAARNNLENEALEPATPGELNFGKGAVLTLGEILEKATAAFGAPVTSDRPVETIFFVSGSYSLKTLTAALEASKAEDDLKVEENPPYRQKVNQVIMEMLGSQWKPFSQSQVDTSWLRGSVPIEINPGDPEGTKLFHKQYGAVESVPASYFMEGRTISAEELGRGRIGLHYHLKANGVANDALLQLGLRMTVNIASPGQYVMHGTLDVQDGKVVMHKQDIMTTIYLSKE